MSCSGKWAPINKTPFFLKELEHIATVKHLTRHALNLRSSSNELITENISLDEPRPFLEKRPANKTDK